jgi:predicted secreted protein
MVSDGSPRKIPNMASQGFTGRLFHKEVLPGRSSLGLVCQVTMVCASSIANYGTMVPFLVEMCIFAFPTTFVTSIFSVST